MNTHAPSLRTGSFATLMALLLVVMTTGCGSLLQRTANLEDDELYLGRDEAFITDAEYLAYAYEQAGYNGVTGSNTLFFETMRGWTGLLVEPATTPFEAARNVRRCDCVQLAVAAAISTPRSVCCVTSLIDMRRKARRMRRLWRSGKRSSLTRVRTTTRF